MKRLLLHSSASEEYVLVDPASFSEIDFEAEVVRALSRLYKDYWCGVFAGAFLFENERRIADLALVHKSLSHWFVIEVELTSHSLEGHVLPQVRCFRFGEPEDSCVTSLCRAFNWLKREHAINLLRFIPRSVAVITNRHDEKWRLSLQSVDAQMMVLSKFAGDADREAVELDGHLHVAKESLGFGLYSSTDKSIRLPKRGQLLVGEIQVIDPFGSPAIWKVAEGGDNVWLRRVSGDPALPHGHYIQVMRSYDGGIVLRLTAQ